MSPHTLDIAGSLMPGETLTQYGTRRRVNTDGTRSHAAKNRARALRAARKLKGNR